MTGEPVRPYILAIFAVFLMLVPRSDAMAYPAGASPADAQQNPMFQPAPGTGPETGCDSEFWHNMKWRAWMEGQHDMETAQTLIEQAPSILDVSCFDGTLQHVQNAGGGIFGGSGTLGPMFSSYIRAGLGPYFNNFTNGGTGIPAGGLGCSRMNAVWKLAACSNFDKDTFYKFSELRRKDPRLGNCSFGGDSRAGWGLALEGLPLVYNATKDAAGTYIMGVYPKPGERGGMTPQLTYLTVIDPKECAKTPAVPTGLVVDQLGLRGGPFDDAACIAPGCWYDYKEKKCKGN
jgi:hypothetical protein